MSCWSASLPSGLWSGVSWRYPTGRPGCLSRCRDLRTNRSAHWCFGVCGALHQSVCLCKVVPDQRRLPETRATPPRVSGSALYAISQNQADSRPRIVGALGRARDAGFRPRLLVPRVRLSLRDGVRQKTNAVATAGVGSGFTHQNYSVADSVGERPLRGAKRLTSNV